MIVATAISAAAASNTSAGDTVILAAITATGLLVAGLFAIYKWTRGGEKTSAIVTQQSTLLTDMRTLYETLEATTARLRAEAALTEADLVACRAITGGLKTRVADLEQQIEERLRLNGLEP